jgi:hypothetical protein
MPSGSMKIVLAALLLAAVSGEAHAISRYSSTKMSCNSIRATVQAEGAAIFRWKQQPDLDRFDRLVAHTGYCLWGELATPTDIPSADSKHCMVLNCQRPVFDDMLIPLR